MNLVKGQHALVTGGGTGIGFGIAKRLLEEGAIVLIVGRREEVLEAAVLRLQQAVPGAQIACQSCDVTDEEQLAAAVATAANAQGQLDIMVANAGSGFPGPILELDASAWRYCCDLNIVGTALCIKHAGRAMKENGGSIITISSVSAKYQDLWMAPYGASKAGMEHLTKSAAIELASFNIRVNSVAPGFVETEVINENFSDELKADCAQRALLEHRGEPEDLGNAVLYLASSLSRWVTGQVLGVDGGIGVHQGTDYASMAEMVVGEQAMKDAGYRK